MAKRSKAIYLDADKPVETRVKDLVSRMTLDEKISQMVYNAPAIERLGIPEYNWWNECLHGVARAGVATVFPQAIGLAAAWDADFMYRVATAISDEARAKHHKALQENNHAMYFGLTYWSPNVNIFRDPRWGRGQETYGEDPYLTSRLGVAFVKGLQGEDPKYLKLVATPKHYAAHSGPEADRHRFDARVTERDLRQTYLPAFQACVQEGQAASVMGAYNRTNGEACCASPTLLQEILREQWGFDGYVVSDCGAIDDIYRHHKLAKTPEEAASLAVRNGCDLNCGKTYSELVKASAEGLISEAEIDQAVTRLFKARFRLGMFDPPDRVAYARIPYKVVDCAEHRALALEAAHKSIVLLKNQGNLLPLSKEIDSIAVIGPNADNAQVLLGNYNGTPAESTTVLEGIRRKVKDGIKVRYACGCNVTGNNKEGFPEAVEIARRSKLAVVVMGLSQEVEGEEGQLEGNPPGISSQGDRTQIGLPGVQEELLQAIYQTGTPVILVLVNGSAIAINWAQKYIPAILEAWYPGQAGGLAVADVLFGDYNPSGRLPVTFYQSVDQLPLFSDYNMEGHTYAYFRQVPLYPFGYGLSYTSFEYSRLEIKPASTAATETVYVRVLVKNTGSQAGDEIVQLYLQDIEASVPVPLYALKGIRRVQLEPGSSCLVEFELEPEQLVCYDDQGRSMIEPGDFRVWVGGHSPASSGAMAELSPMLTGVFTVIGALLFPDTLSPERLKKVRPSRQKPMELSLAIEHNYHLEYLLHLPRDLNRRKKEKWPLILFLHGAGERGNDLNLVRIHGIPRIVEEWSDFPFITVSPQCPENSWWSDQIPALDALLNKVVAEYPVDEDRLYLTGLSMGGFGAWHLAVTYPDRFAALAPICGSGPWHAGFPERVRVIKHVPTWVFHGAKDRTVLPRESKVLVKELQDCGGNVRFTLYPHAAHDSWTETYRNPELYDWFLSHKKA
jgi:beta-glucosidase